MEKLQRERPLRENGTRLRKTPLQRVLFAIGCHPLASAASRSFHNPWSKAIWEWESKIGHLFAGVFRNPVPFSCMHGTGRPVCSGPRATWGVFHCRPGHSPGYDGAAADHREEAPRNHDQPRRGGGPESRLIAGGSGPGGLTSLRSRSAFSGLPGGWRAGGPLRG